MEWTADRVDVENVNRIRERVARWRKGGWTNVTPTTRRLLDYWHRGRLRRALKTEIRRRHVSDPLSTVSRPFLLLSTGKIAAKVINHCGDEVLQLYAFP